MKNSSICILLFHLFNTTLLHAQVPALQWQKTFGGSDNDFAFSIEQTKDGGYIVAGETESFNGDVQGNHGEEDFWVIKLDGKGNLQWQNALGGFGAETAFEVEQTTDGGYIVAGEAYSNSGDVTGNHGNLDFWVVRLDENGNIVWQKSLGGTNRDGGTSVQQTYDGGFIVAGSSFSNNGDVSGHNGTTFLEDFWVVKLDDNGNIQWEDSYGGSATDMAFSVRQTNDGGYIVAGNSESNNGDVSGVHDFTYGDFWVIKLSTDGALQWQKAYGGNDYDQANSVKQTTDGGYIIAGFSRSHDGDVTNSHGNYDMWVVKTDDQGNLQWQKSLGGSKEDFGYDVQQTPDGGYIVAGSANSNNGNVTGNHGDEDIWIVKLDGNGNLQWQSALGGSSWDRGRGIDQTSDGGYIAAGYSDSNNGNVTGNHGQYDFWVLKLFACNCIPPISGLNASNVTATTAKVSWDTVACVLSYKLQYRIVGSSTWTTKKLNGNVGAKKLNGLSPSTTYEWRIASQCSSNKFSSYSSIETFTTDALKEEESMVSNGSGDHLQLVIFPNPAKDFINLIITSPEKITSIEIQDVSGRLIMLKDFTIADAISHQQVDVADFSPGVYYVSVKTENQVASMKWVKQ